MLSHLPLSTLRLRTQLEPDARIVEHKEWEWMGNDWWYEGLGFTWFGRLGRDPAKTAAVELSLPELSVSQLAVLSTALAFPVKHGMSLREVTELLGQPVSSEQFVPDRKSYDFQVSSESAYRVSATIRNAEVMDSTHSGARRPRETAAGQARLLPAVVAITAPPAHRPS